MVDVGGQKISKSRLVEETDTPDARMDLVLALSYGSRLELTEAVRTIGPPSEVIDVGSRTVFYYLLEETHSEALSLILVTKAETRVRYDRAIFFFDERDVLVRQSLSPTAIE